MSAVNEHSIVEARSNKHSIPKSVKNNYGMNCFPVIFKPFRVDLLHSFPTGTLHHTIAWAFNWTLRQSRLKKQLRGFEKDLRHNWTHRQPRLKKHLRGCEKDLREQTRGPYDTVAGYSIHPSRDTWR